MSSEIKQELDAKFRNIGLDRDYSELDTDLEPDIQGWGSNSPIFEGVLKAIKPSLVIEIGSWKGASIIHMAKVAAAENLDTCFICVDTWLGSNETLWLDPEYRRSLRLRGGYPSMFRQFVANIKHVGLQDRIYPLPMTSSAAFYLLRRLAIRPDAIYVDAGHEEDEVYLDLKLYFDLLRPGGVMFGDDYSPQWPGVPAAVNRFAAERKLVLQCGNEKFVFQKTAA